MKEGGFRGIAWKERGCDELKLTWTRGWEIRRMFKSNIRHLSHTWSSKHEIPWYLGTSGLKADSVPKLFNKLPKNCSMRHLAGESQRGKANQKDFHAATRAMMLGRLMDGGRCMK